MVRPLDFGPFDDQCDREGSWPVLGSNGDMVSSINTACLGCGGGDAIVKFGRGLRSMLLSSAEKS